MVVAGTGISGSSTTFTEDGVEEGNINVILLGTKKVLGPNRTIKAADRGGIARSRVGLSNLTTVLPLTVKVLTERSVARNSALHSSHVTNRLRTSVVAIDRVKRPGPSTREILDTVDAVARTVTNGRFTTVEDEAVAILSVRQA